VAYEIKIDIRRDKSRAVFATPAFLFLAAESTEIIKRRKNQRAKSKRQRAKMNWAFADELGKSQKESLFVIPAKAGIQFFPSVISSLDSGFHRSDDFSVDHLYWSSDFFSISVISVSSVAKELKGGGSEW
jgi:hypothetical protein